MKNAFTIFYTDDDQEDLEFFKEIIDTIDADVSLLTQSNGKELLNALHNPPPHPHLVFLDINMPGMTGYEVLKELRRSHQKLPVVMFSTSGDHDSISKSRELGATYYLPKSGIFDQLKRSIEHALSINWGSFIPNDKNFVYSH
ncbi:response regulator [Flavobacterium sp.]|uniref:response regulator n=1 Tax=Flavobacterium sp. TaxID=239 RepID=UPI004034A2D7